MRNPGSRYKWILFRLAAILLSLSPLLLLEIVLQATQWQPPVNRSEINDPYIGFSEVRPLFVLSEDKSRFEVSPQRYPLFRPESFLAEKPANEFRIFCLGGSTVQGRPFAIETSFTTWLELGLKAADQRFDWEVINCGGVSYASYRLLPILKEVLNYQPDLIILYTGHNEFLEDRTYQDIKAGSRWIANSHEGLSRFKSYRFLRGLFIPREMVAAKPDAPAEQLPADAEARLDFRGGLELYQRDDPWQQAVIQHYELNLRNMIELAAQADVPIVLMNPVSNLRDMAPFKSQHNGELPELALERCKRIWDKRNQSEMVDAKSEIDGLLELLEIDDRFAAAHFRLGQAYHSLRQFDLARKHFLLAKDNDVCPLRMLEPMHEVLKHVSTETSTPLIDIRQLFESRDENGIPGKELLLDHVHPTIFGHQLIANSIQERLTEMGIVAPLTDGKSARDASYVAHLQALPFMYFQRGKDRLAGLRRWTTGKVTREKGEPLKPMD